MARKRYKPEEIVAKLRQVDVLVSQGQSVVDAVRSFDFGRTAPGDDVSPPELDDLGGRLYTRRL
jgi:hypothetical protein